MTSDIITAREEPKRSDAYIKLLGELKQSFIKAGEMVLTLYEQGKKDGLPNHIIRKHIETALDGIAKERRLREILPLELKRQYTINKVDDSEMSAELNECKDEHLAALMASEQEAISLAETMKAIIESLKTGQRLYDDLEKRLRSKREGGTLIYEDYIELAIFAWNGIEKQEAEMKLLKVLERKAEGGYQHFQDLLKSINGY